MRATATTTRRTRRKEHCLTMYANILKEQLNNNELMREDIKNKAVYGIGLIVNAYEVGSITLNEAMGSLATGLFFDIGR